MLFIVEILFNFYKLDFNSAPQLYAVFYLVFHQVFQFIFTKTAGGQSNLFSSAFVLDVVFLLNKSTDLIRRYTLKFVVMVTINFS